MCVCVFARNDKAVFGGGCVWNRGVPSPTTVVWRTLTGRVSIKQGSTMKKIGGPKGQVGGGQQGEVRLNGNSSDVGCVCCVRGLHTGKRGGRVCFRGCAGTYSVAFPLVSDPKCERRRLPSHPSLSLFHSPSLSSLSSSAASPSSLPSTLVLVREQYHSRPCPACIWVKTLQSRAIDCAYQINRVAPANPPPTPSPLSSPSVS